MAKIKTKPTKADAMEFLNSVENEQKRADSLEILEMMKKITGKNPVMWGDSIIGFDRYSYTNTTGDVNEWPMIGFAPRKRNLTIYIMPGFERYEALLDELGKHSTGKSCLYINKLADVDKDVLQDIAKISYGVMKKQNSG